MRRIGQAGVVVVLLLAGIVVPTTAAQACSCVMGTPAGTRDWADAVFLGKVVEREGRQATELNDGVLNGGPFTYTFEVERVFKGEVAVDQRVVAGANGAACGIVLKPGATYLVYGTAGRALGLKAAAPDEYVTHLCSGTARASTAPASYGEGAPPPTSAGYLSTATQTDPDVDTSSSVVSTGAVVAGGAIVGLALIVGVLYLRRRRGA